MMHLCVHMCIYVPCVTYDSFMCAHLYVCTLCDVWCICVSTFVYMYCVWTYDSFMCAHLYVCTLCDVWCICVCTCVYMYCVWTYDSLMCAHLYICTVCDIWFICVCTFVCMYLMWHMMHFTRISYAISLMGWLRLVGSIKLYVSFAEFSLFYRALWQKKPMIWSILRTVATPYAMYLMLYRMAKTHRMP